MKSILFGDLFENNSKKKVASFILMFVLTFIIALTMSIDGLPWWGYAIGILLPMGIWAWVKPHKVFEGCKFLEED